MTPVIHGGQVIEQAARRIMTHDVALVAADGAGGLFNFQNPHDVRIIITRVILDITTQATGACTADVGSAANATTLGDDVIDGVDIGTAVGVFDNIDDQGTNGSSQRELAANGGAADFLTGSVASGASAGLVGQAHIEYKFAEV